jgi:ssDNA-binding Zn-finger/Zn-ribbon topoisomerase 1
MKDTTEDTTAPLGVSPMDAWNVFQSAMGKSSKRQDEIIKWVESGGDVRWTCTEGMTLLHYAAMMDDQRMVRFLLERGANVNALAKFQMTPLLQACRNVSTSVIPILLEHGADPNAKTDSGYTALQFIRQSGLDEAKKMADLILSHGVKTTPGKDSTCPECGAPETVRMRERGVEVTFNGIFARFDCPKCHEANKIPLDAIEKEKGVSVQCVSSCRNIAYVPPTVWCKICGRGLSTGWQKQISTGQEAEKAAREFTSPDVKRARVLARDLKAAHGKLKVIHFKSHFPNFEIDFDFSDGKRICSGKGVGDIVGAFAFGYFGGGPNRLQIFLDEMGLSISADEIEKIKPGTTMEVEGASLRLPNDRSELGSNK